MCKNMSEQQRPKIDKYHSSAAETAAIVKANYKY
jgi:hypothetical protein